jgi:hypothetical protein
MSLWDALGIAPTTGIALAVGSLVSAALLALRILVSRNRADGPRFRLNDPD